MPNLIIDPVNDTDYPTQVRALLGVDSDELSTATLILDIVLGTAEREICSQYVPNWMSVLNGDDQIKADSLKASVIIKVALNLISMPAVQNILIDKVKFIDTIVESKQIPIEEIRASLQSFFDKQLSMVGIVHDEEWPDRTIIGKSDTFDPYDYYVDLDGNIQKN